MLRALLSPLANIILGLFLIGAFYIAGTNIAQTFTVAHMAALNYLRPNPIDYLWDVNIHQAPLDKNKIRYFADYYENMLQVFPSMRDAYGLLGYCYHYLNDDPKAIKFLKIAIQENPDYFWNYYNLTVIYINESRYQEARTVLLNGLKIDPMVSLKAMVSSPWVYVPLLGSNPKAIVRDSPRHLQWAYQTSFLLEQVLRHADRKGAQEMIKKLHLELYAF